MASRIGTRNGKTSESAMNSGAPKLFVIQTEKEEISVTAMDTMDAVQTWISDTMDAVQTWISWGGVPTELLAIEEHENRADETVH